MNMASRNTNQTVDKKSKSADIAKSSAEDMLFGEMTQSDYAIFRHYLESRLAETQMFARMMWPKWGSELNISMCLSRRKGFIQNGKGAENANN